MGNSNSCLNAQEEVKCTSVNRLELQQKTSSTQTSNKNFLPTEPTNIENNKALTRNKIIQNEIDINEINSIKNIFEIDGKDDYDNSHDIDNDWYAQQLEEDLKRQQMEDCDIEEIVNNIHSLNKNNEKNDEFEFIKTKGISNELILKQTLPQTTPSIKKHDTSSITNSSNDFTAFNNTILPQIMTPINEIIDDDEYFNIQTCYQENDNNDVHYLDDDEFAQISDDDINDQDIKDLLKETDTDDNEKESSIYDPKKIKGVPQLKPSFAGCLSLESGSHTKAFHSIE